jgi:hypothetical protein
MLELELRLLGDLLKHSGRQNLPQGHTTPHVLNSYDRTGALRRTVEHTLARRSSGFSSLFLPHTLTFLFLQFRQPLLDLMCGRRDPFPRASGVMPSKLRKLSVHVLFVLMRVTTSPQMRGIDASPAPPHSLPSQGTLQ